MREFEELLLGNNIDEEVVVEVEIDVDDAPDAAPWAVITLPCSSTVAAETEAA